MGSVTPRHGKLSSAGRAALFTALEARFEKHMNRHEDHVWLEIRARVDANPEKLRALHEMERTGGEPDVVVLDRKTGECVFVDCSAETPRGRISVCYDRAALESRKEHKPQDSAMDMAAAMGIDLLDEGQYLELQKLGEFDTKTSSWLATPADIRERGGALHGERRYGRIFIGHNGAPSYYAVRGFRGMLKI